MTIKDAIFATVEAEGPDGLRGRTLLQKKLYFLSILTNEDFQYSPHYYGPYSALVADHLGALKEAGFVKEEVSFLPALPGPFGEPRQYSYSLSPAGREVLEERKKQVSVYRGAINKVNGHPTSTNTNLISIAAKVHFIVSERGRAKLPEIQDRARTLGWKITDEEVLQVIEYLKSLDLVETA